MLLLKRFRPELRYDKVSATRATRAPAPPLRSNWLTHNWLRTAAEIKVSHRLSSEDARDSLISLSAPERNHSFIEPGVWCTLTIADYALAGSTIDFTRNCEFVLRSRSTGSLRCSLEDANRVRRHQMMWLRVRDRRPSVYGTEGRRSSSVNSTASARRIGLILLIRIKHRQPEKVTLFQRHYTSSVAVDVSVSAERRREILQSERPPAPPFP